MSKLDNLNREDLINEISDLEDEANTMAKKNELLKELIDDIISDIKELLHKIECASNRIK